MTTSTLSKAATGALIALTLAPISVEATITSVTVNTSRDYEHAGGYAYAEITVHGTVDRADGSVGVYTVTAVLIHPRPIFRAALENLTRWTSGNHRESPPPSQYFRGSVDAIDAFVPMTDVDGHFAGGVRLPHVESTMHGRVAGAPLGRHTPLNPLGLDPFNLFVFVSGTFTRFSDDELAGPIWVV